MSQFDAPVLPSSTPMFASRVSLSNYEASTVLHTRSALQGLIETIQSNPALYTRIQDARAAEVSRASVFPSWEWLSRFSWLHANEHTKPMLVRYCHPCEPTPFHFFLSYAQTTSDKTSKTIAAKLVADMKACFEYAHGKLLALRPTCQA
jgi:hypothetical protein